MREQGGRKLLREWLSPEQLAQYDAHNYFKVTGCHIGKRYRIRHGMGANVYELLRWSTADWLVLRTQASSRRGDVMLVQKIALETDERNAVPESCYLPPPTGFDSGRATIRLSKALRLTYPRAQEGKNTNDVG